MPASAASSPSLTAASAPADPDPIAADDNASTPVTPPTSATPTAPATSSAARRKKKRRKAAAAAAAAAAVAAASSSSTVDLAGTSVTFTAELDSPDWTGIVRALSGLLGDSGAISSSSRTLTSLIPLLSGADDEVLSDLQALLRRDTQKLTAALREAGNGLMAALAGPSGSGEKPMMSAADLAALEAQVDAAKRETAMWEQELRRVMTRNRQAGLM